MIAFDCNFDFGVRAFRFDETAFNFCAFAIPRLEWFIFIANFVFKPLLSPFECIAFAKPGSVRNK